MLNLAERAVLAHLSISQWTARRYDRVASDGVNTAHGITDDAARVNKRLLAKDALTAIASIVQSARADHDKLTLPWGLRGVAILPTPAYLEYRRIMLAHSNKFDHEANAFAANYVALRDAARSTLGGLFNLDDYPEPDCVRRRFRFELQIMPVPSADDFRVNLDNEMLDAIRQDVAASTQAAANEAIRTIFERAKTVLEAMSAGLDRYVPGTAEAKASGVFRDTLVGNVREMAETLPLLNVFGDAAIESLAAQMRKLAKPDASDLRDSDALRKVAAETARSLVDNIAASAASYF